MKTEFKNFTTYIALLNAVNTALMCGFTITGHKNEDIRHKFKNPCFCDIHMNSYTLEQNNKMLVLSQFVVNVVGK